jgi:hypothetical protein
MINNNNFYKLQQTSLEKLNKVREEIDEEYEKEEVDQEKINKLMYQQLMVSLPLTVYNKFRPLY